MCLWCLGPLFYLFLRLRKYVFNVDGRGSLVNFLLKYVRLLCLDG